MFYFSELSRDGRVTVAELVQAGEKRLRPILMSTLIAILTVTSMALGVSRGAGLQQPLATAISFGLTVAVPLVVLILPAFVMMLSSGFGSVPGRDTDTHRTD